jgi:mannose-6-phosphate isomerase-like protein (cupin superfamily)
MIVYRNEMRREAKEQMRGGEGTTSFVHFQEAGEMRNARLLAEITLPPGASIGDHAHDAETEYYIILSGTGIVADDGTDKPVSPGDVVVTGNGARHSIRNAGQEPLVFHAAVITY